MNGFLHQASFVSGNRCYDWHRSVRLVICIGLAIDQIAQSGLSFLKVIYYFAQLFRSVYKFGCAFIHLSIYHDYSETNPFDSLDFNERSDILSHLRYYHGGPSNDNPSFSELAEYFPHVFEKISDNLGFYLECLEGGKTNSDAL